MKVAIEIDQQDFMKQVKAAFDGHLKNLTREIITATIKEEIERKLKLIDGAFVKDSFQKELFSYIKQKISPSWGNSEISNMIKEQVDELVKAELARNLSNIQKLVEDSVTKRLSKALGD